MPDQIPQENYDSGAQTPFNFQDAVLGDFFQYSYPPLIPLSAGQEGQGGQNNPPEIVNLPSLQEYQSYFYNTIDLISPSANQILNQRGKNYSNVNYISSNDISILGTGVSFTQDAINALAIAGGSLPVEGGRAAGLTVGQYFSPWSGKLYWSNNLDSTFDKVWKSSKDQKVKYYPLKYLLEYNRWNFGITLGLNAPLNPPQNFYRRALKVSEIWTAGATYQYSPSEYGRWRNLRNYQFRTFDPIDPWTGASPQWRYSGQIMPGQTWGEAFAEQRTVGESAPTVTLPNGSSYNSIQPEQQLRGEARTELAESDVNKFPYDAAEVAYAAAYTKYKIDNGITRGAQNYLEYATEIGNESEWVYVNNNSSGLTYIKNYALAPDGTNTATLLIFPKTTSPKYSFVRQFDTNLSGNDNNLTFSVWIKKPSEILEYPGTTASDRVGLRLSWGDFFPDAATSTSQHGIIGFTASGIGVTLTNNQSGYYIGGGETYLNDWYRVWIKPTFAPTTQTPTFTASIAIPNPTDGNEFWTNSGNTLGLLVWGAQVEDGTGPSDFITSNTNSAFKVTSTFNPQDGRTDQVDLDNFKAYYANMLGHATGEIYPTPEEKLARRWVPLARSGIKLPAGWSGPPEENSYPPADDQMFVSQGGRGLYGLYLGSAWTMRMLVYTLDALEGRDIVDQNLFNKTKDLIRYELQRIAFTMANSYRGRYGWNTTYGVWNPLYWWPVDSKAGWVSNQLIEPMTGLLMGVMYLNKDMKNPGFLSRKLYDLGIEFFRINMDLFGPGIEWHEGIAYFSQSSWIFNELGKVEKLNGDQRLKTHLSGQNYLGPLWRWAFHMRLPGKRYVNYGDGISNIEGYYVASDRDWNNVLNSVIAEGTTLGYKTYKYFHPTLYNSIGADAYGYSKLKWAEIYGELPPINTPPSGLTLYEYFPNIRVAVWRDKWERVHVENNPKTFAVWIKGEGLEDAHTHRDAGHFSVYDGNRIIFGECGTQRPYPSPDNIMAHQANGHNIFRLLDRYRARTVDCPMTVKYLDTIGGGITLNTTAAYYQGGEYGAEGLTGVSFCYREFYWRKETSGATAQLNILDNVIATDPLIGIPDFGATAWYHFHTGCTGGPNGLSLTISGANKNWTAAWPGVTMTFISDREITVGQKDYIDYYNQIEPGYESNYPGINSWPGIHKCVDIICPSGCTGLSLSTQVDITLFNPNPAPPAAPLLAATWKGLDSQSGGLWDVQDIAGLSYVVPMVWLSYNDAFSVTPNLATSTIETPTNIKTKITEAESQLGFSLTNKVFLAPRRYWYLDSFWGSTFDNIPTGFSYTNANEYTNQVFITPWADKGIDGARTEWLAWLYGYNGISGPLDFLVMDQENYGQGGNYWAITGVTSTNNKRINYLKGLTSDSRFNNPWNGLLSLNQLLSGISLTKLDFTNGALCTGCSYEYIKYNEAIEYYGIKTVDKAIWDPTKTVYPSAKGSNYDGHIMTNQPAPDYNGHPQSRTTYFGTAASPALYGGNELIGSTSSVWYVNQSNPTEVIYKDNTGYPPAGYTYGYKIPAGPNVWASFQLDIQFARACRRSAPNLPLWPWIANYNFGNPAISGSQPTSGASYWQNKKYYYEMIRHVSLLGAEGFLYWNTVDGATSGPRITGKYTSDLDDVLREINGKLGNRPVTETVTLTPIPFTTVDNFNASRHSSKIVISGAKLYNGKYLWRATTGETLATAFQDIVSGQTYGLSGDLGIWLNTDTRTVPGLTTYYS